MTEASPGPLDSKTAIQLLEEFQMLNDQAIAIHARLALIALRLAGCNSITQMAAPATTDTVEM